MTDQPKVEVWVVIVGPDPDEPGREIRLREHPLQIIKPKEGLFRMWPGKYGKKWVCDVSAGEMFGVEVRYGDYCLCTGLAQVWRDPAEKEITDPWGAPIPLTAEALKGLGGNG
jgi:hypothetical protein